MTKLHFLIYRLVIGIKHIIRCLMNILTIFEVVSFAGRMLLNFFESCSNSVRYSNAFP